MIVKYNEPIEIHMTLQDVCVGDWIQVYSQITKRYMPPTRITAIFCDGTIQHEIDEEQGDPFEDHIRDARPIRINRDTLKGFGFTVSNQKFHEDFYPYYDCLLGDKRVGTLVPLFSEFFFFCGSFWTGWMHEMIRHLSSVSDKPIKITWHGV